MSYSETISTQQFTFTIVEDSEKRIKPQKTVINLFDQYLELKFKKHKNKRLEYESIYRWTNNKEGNMIKIEYISRKSDNYRLLTFVSNDDYLANELADRLMEHCQFMADVNREREMKGDEEKMGYNGVIKDNHNDIKL